MRTRCALLRNLVFVVRRDEFRDAGSILGNPPFLRNLVVGLVCHPFKDGFAVLCDQLRLGGDERRVASPSKVLAMGRYKQIVIVQHEVVLLDFKLGLLTTLLILDGNLVFYSPTSAACTAGR